MALVKLGRLLVCVAVAAYAVVFLNPQLIFAYEVRSGNVALRARSPLPAEAQGVADEVRRRIARSPLYDDNADYIAYLCESRELFAVFAPFDRNVGAIAQPLVTGNVFLRPSRIERDRLVGPSGKEVEGERTLSYFISHELTHVMIGRELGRTGYARLPVWKDDGYCDYVAKAGLFDFGAAVEAFRAGEKALDPARSGLYVRYHLLTELCLDRNGMSVREFLRAPLDVRRLEDALRALAPTED